LGGRCLTNNEEVKDAIKQWLNELVMEVYDEGIQKLITGYDKCLNGGDKCVEKYLKVCNNDTSFFLNVYFVYISLLPNGLYFLDDPRISLRSLLMLTFHVPSF